ncbi:hypothetical protein NFI96_019220 [Prochilodus magdalenae]|nr:hypothetical protein NFI96_019220 [Prochilodus magdalenae]
MGRTEELSDFQRGTVIGCHLSKKSVREISAMLDLPRSTVSNVIVKWKRLGATTALPRSGRPHKLSDRDLRVLERVANENRLSPVAALTAEFQNASGSSVSTRTVRRELHGMGFRGQAAARKPKIIRRNAKSALKLPSKKQSKTKPNTISDKEGNTSMGEEDHGHTDVCTSSEPAVQVQEKGDSSASQSNEPQSNESQS